MAISYHSADLTATPAAYTEAAGAPIHVPSAGLIHGAQFERAGANDLKLTAADGEEFLILNYFGAATPQPLIAPNQTILDGATVELLAGPLFPGQLAQAGPGPAAAPEAIGSVAKLEGAVTVQHADGTSKQLAVGDLVFESDVITTGESSLVGIKLADGTLLNLQESGKAVLSEFNFEVGGTDNSALLSILEGTFSMLAGQVAPTGDMKIATPIATMGVRGTSILGVDVNAPGGRLSLTQDPDGHVGFIEVFNNINGEMFTVLRTIFSKISISENGMLVLAAKSPNEQAFDQSLTELLHQFYSTNDTPQAGPQNQNAPNTGSPNFAPPDVQEINFGPEVPGAETITIPPELFFAFLEQIIPLLPPLPPLLDGTPPPIGPEAGGIGVRPLDEDDIGGDAAMAEGVLPFSGGVVSLAGLHGEPVIDAKGNPVESGDVPLVYDWNPLTSTLTAIAGQQEIFSIQIDPVTGEFKVTLIGAVDHGQSDTLGIDVEFTIVAPNGTTTTGEISIAIEDSEPAAVNDVANVDDPSFMVFIDVSGSMGSDPGVDGFQTRLQLAQEAVRQLFLNVVAAEVLIVAFADQAQAAFFDNFADGSAFVSSLVPGNTVIDSVNLGNGTNFEAALQAAMTAWNDGSSTGELDFVHFLTDGLPGVPIGAQSQAAWEAFLAQNGVEEAFAVGIGDGLTGNEAALDPIAWRPDDPDADPIFVNDENDLIETLVGTIDVRNVLNGAGADDFGADGPGGITSIEIDGVTYVFDGESIDIPDGLPPHLQVNALTRLDCAELDGGSGLPPVFADGTTLHVMTELGGFFTFQFADGDGHKAGDWEYLPPVEGDHQSRGEGDSSGEPPLPYENFRYTIEDSEGDAATANLTIVFDDEKVDGVLQGSSGNDVITGGSQEAEVLVGGLGADTFVLNGQTIADYIADYDFGAGDQIDLSGLISFDPASDDLDNFVRLTEVDDGGLANDELQIDATGTGQNFTTVAVLNGNAGISVIVNDAGDAEQVGGNLGV